MNTPLKDLDTKLVCTDCQQAALDRIQEQAKGYMATFKYCESTGRSLVIEGMDGAAWRWMVSQPADRSTLEATWQSWRNKRQKALEIGAAMVEREQAELDGGRLQ